MKARIKATGQLLYTSEDNDLFNDHHCWFNMEDGNHRDCMFVMDNKRFRQMLKDEEVEILKDAAP